MAIELPQDLVHDVRQPVNGDSFNWAGLEPTAAKRWLVFHHSGSDAVAEDAFSIADYHVNHNGWSGIGYHLVITRKDYPGRPEHGLPPGAQIQYCGDLGTFRAHVFNQNPGKVGVCLVGLTPDDEQLKLARQLVDFFIAPNNILPSINYYNQVTVHRLVPEQQTSCPGDDYGRWLPYLQGGAEPWTPEPVSVLADLPEYEASYRDQPETKVTQVDGFAHDMTGASPVVSVPKGTSIDIAGYFTDNGTQYARTVYSKAHDKWYGLPSDVFTAPTGQPADAVIPVTVVPGSITLPDPQPTETPSVQPEIPTKLGFFSALGILLIHAIGPAIRFVGNIIRRRNGSSS